MFCNLLTPGLSSYNNKDDNLAILYPENLVQMTSACYGCKKYLLIKLNKNPLCQIALQSILTMLHSLPPHRRDLIFPHASHHFLLLVLLLLPP